MPKAAAVHAPSNDQTKLTMKRYLAAVLMALAFGLAFAEEPLVSLGADGHYRPSPEANYLIGLSYFLGEGAPKNHSVAAKWLRKAADGGHAPAQEKLGHMYREGDGVTQSAEEAAKWFLKAAAAGETTAQYMLGLMFIEGRGILQDYGEAAKWLKRASAQGSSDGQAVLSVLYWAGMGVSRDRVTAHMWANLSAAQGNLAAASTRAKLSNEMTPAQLDRAQYRARACQAQQYKDCD